MYERVRPDHEINHDPSAFASALVVASKNLASQEGALS